MSYRLQNIIYDKPNGISDLRFGYFGYMPQSPIPMPTATPSAVPSYPYYQPIFNTPNPLIQPGAINTAAGALAQSLALGVPPQLPPPEAMAPCLFNSHLPYGMGNVSPNMTSYYNYSPVNYMPWAQPPSPYPSQYPQPYPPNMSPAAQPLTNPENKPPEAEKPPADDKAKKDELPKPVENAPLLSQETVRELNTMLQSSDYILRLEGAKKLAKIINGDPDLLSKPQYSKYAEALIMKVLKDPNSLVHQPILLSLQLGNINTPTQSMIAALNTLKQERGLYNFEPGIIEQVLTTLNEKMVAANQAAQQSAGAPATAALNPAMQDFLKQQQAGGKGMPTTPPNMAINPATQALAQRQQMAGKPGNLPMSPAALQAMMRQRPPGYQAGPMNQWPGISQQGPRPVPRQMAMGPQGASPQQQRLNVVSS